MGVPASVRDQLDLGGGNLRFVQPPEDCVPLKQTFSQLLLLPPLVCCPPPQFMLQILSDGRHTALLDYKLYENRSLISYS